MRIDNVILDYNTALLIQKIGALTLVSNNEMNITGKTLNNIQEINNTSHQVNLQDIAIGNMLIFRIQMNNEKIIAKKVIKE